jgi:hypothetical protein
MQTTELVNNQFNVLRQIDTLLGQASIPFWLRGGWALDFLLGRVTRTHSDLDLVIWRRDAEVIRPLLLRSGFEFYRETELQVDFFHHSHEICFLFVDGTLEKPYVQGVPSWVWVSDALRYSPQQLNGLSCQVLSPRQLLEEKEGMEPGTGRQPRPKDLRSMEILRTFIKTERA